MKVILSRFLDLQTRSISCGYRDLLNLISQPISNETVKLFSPNACRNKIHKRLFYFTSTVASCVIIIYSPDWNSFFASPRAAYYFIVFYKGIICFIFAEMHFYFYFLYVFVTIEMVQTLPRLFRAKNDT